MANLQAKDGNGALVFIKATGTGTNADPFSTDVSIGTQADASATADTGTFSLIALVKRLLGKLPTLVTGRMPVDGSGVTQPVSATALPLPTGAATEVTLGNLSAKLPGTLVGGRLVVDGSGVTQPVSGTLAISNSFALDATAVGIRDRLPSTLENGGLRISNNLAPASGISGSKTITAANTFETLTTAAPLRSGIEVQAATVNTGIVFVRYVGSTDGIALTAGNSRYFPINNTNQIDVSVSVAGERVRWMGS